MSASPPVSAAEFKQLREAFEAFRKGKEKYSDDENQDDNKSETQDESRSSSSSKLKERVKPSHPAVDEDDDDETIVNLDVLSMELENQFDEIKFMGNGWTTGLTKFPSNEGCEFSKDNAAYISQLRKCYKALKTIIRICIAGASHHPTATDTFNTAITVALWGVHSVLATHHNLYFKGVMGNSFKVWCSLNTRGISSEEHRLAVDAMQFSTATAITKAPSHFSNAPKRQGGRSGRFNGHSNNNFNKSKRGGCRSGSTTSTVN